ncbi:RNA-binding S4 domain-containing protein [Sphingobacterium sp. IITKGP-BTPF85]|nr:RNA-binding S4 domain-containing protein [Sphingobacterium sp. IITKGP-BTPF85]
MAQLVVTEGMVTVNGQVEYRKRMKLDPMISSSLRVNK